MKMNFSIKNILFIQDSSPCIRNIKMATALKLYGLSIHLIHRQKNPDQAYGFGNDVFESITRLPSHHFREMSVIKKVISDHKIELIHFHNGPDRLASKMMQYNLGVPVIYDQHDFLSFKGRITRRKARYEKISNEENDGAVYITENYKNVVSSKYKINSHHMVLPNYGVASLLLPEKAILPKLSQRDGSLNLVYVGLITQHKNKVRNLIDIFSALSAQGFHIHVYPTRRKAYPLYAEIPGVVMHQKLPVSQLIREISQYDLGIAFLKHDVSDRNRKDELRYGFWNKIYDYLMAALPVVTMDYYSDMSKFIVENRFGISLKFIEDLTVDSMKKVDLKKISNHIIEHRSKWTMENHISRLIDFYEESSRLYKAEG